MRARPVEKSSAFVSPKLSIQIASDDFKLLVGQIGRISVSGY